MCCQNNARIVPRNYILLLIFTITESIFVGAITAMSEPEIVFIALALTAAMTIGLTIYAMTTSEDFTVCGGLLCVLCLVGLVGVILNMFI